MQDERLRRDPYEMIHVTTKPRAPTIPPAPKSGNEPMFQKKIKPGKIEHHRKDGGLTMQQQVVCTDLIREHCFMDTEGWAVWREGWSDRRLLETVDPTGRVTIDVVARWRKGLVGNQRPQGRPAGEPKPQRMGRQEERELLIAMKDFLAKELGFVPPQPKGGENCDQKET